MLKRDFRIYNGSIPLQMFFFFGSFLLYEISKKNEIRVSFESLLQNLQCLVTKKRKQK